MNTTTAQASVSGPPARLGHFAETFKVFNDPIGYMDRHFAQYGRIFAARTAPLTTPPRSGYPGTFFVYGPNLIRELCSNHDGYHRAALSHRLYPEDEVSARTAPLRRIMTGLAFQKGETHRVHRRLILPAFHRQRVETYLDDIISETERLASEWRIGETYDMSREMNRLIRRISARSLFGQTDQSEGERIGHLIDRWVDFIMSPSHLFPWDAPGIPYRKWLDLSHEIETTTRQMIIAKRESGPDDASLLSMLIRATDEDGVTFTEDDLVGHISLMLWGSRDAAAAALMWTLLLISLHADVHEACVAELSSRLAGSAPSIGDLTQIPFTENALKESLRILPPFPMINRVAAVDGHLGGYDVPSGAELIMSVYHTHRIEELFPEPAAYQPHRWTAIEPATYEYMPFGGGPRMCPGRDLAWQELMVACAILLQRYRFEIADNTTIDRIVKLGLFPKQGLTMTVHRQDGDFSKSVKPIRGNLNQMVSTLPR